MHYESDLPRANGDGRLSFFGGRRRPAGPAPGTSRLLQSTSTSLVSRWLWSRSPIRLVDHATQPQKTLRHTVRAKVLLDPWPNPGRVSSSSDTEHSLPSLIS